MPPRVTKQAAVSSAPTKKGGIWSRIAPMSLDEEGIKILLYGRSGTGKTTLWSTFPGPILVLVCSGGMKPGELRSIDTPENRKKIHTVTLETGMEIMEVCSDPQVEKYKTVVLDHASGLQDRVLAELLDMKDIPVQKSWGLASQQQYGQCTAQCKEFFRALLSLPQNVVIIAQEREFNTESETEFIQPSVGAALSPSLTGWLNPACDYVCQTFLRQRTEERTVKIAGKTSTRTVAAGGVEYCLRVGAHSVYTTKFRKPLGEDLPDVIVDPDFGKIKKLISGKGN